MQRHILVVLALSFCSITGFSSQAKSQTLQGASNAQLVDEVARRLGVVSPGNPGSSGIASVTCVGSDLRISVTTATADSEVVWPMTWASSCQTWATDIGASFNVSNLRIVAACQGGLLKRAALSGSGLRELADINYTWDSSCTPEARRLNAIR